MSRSPDVHDYTTIGRLLGMSSDNAQLMIERWQDSDGCVGPEFSLSEAEVAIRLGRPTATMRSRRKRGQYVENVDYRRVSPRRVLYSRRVLKRETSVVGAD